MNETQPAPTDPLADYRTDRRVVAATSDRPVLRLSRRWLPNSMPYYAPLWIADGHLANGSGRVGVDDLLQMIVDVLDDDDDLVGVLFADRETQQAAVRKLNGYAKRAGDTDARAARQAVRALEVSASLPFSPCFPVLTDLMAKHLWLPEDAPADFAAALADPQHPWTRALANQNILPGVEGATVPQVCAWAGRCQSVFGWVQDDPGSAVVRAFEQAARAARLAVSAGRYASPSANMAAFQAATTVTDQIGFADAIDRAGMREAALAGLAAQVDILARPAVRASACTVAVTGGVLRASERDDLFLYDQRCGAHVSLQGFVPDGDTMLAELSVSPRNMSVVLMLSGSAMLVRSPKVFVPGKPSLRWLSPGANRPVRPRNVPLEVLLAGAPE